MPRESWQHLANWSYGPRQLPVQGTERFGCQTFGPPAEGTRHYDAAAGSARARPHVDHPVGLGHRAHVVPIITTVLPASTRRCNCTSSRSASDACSPVVGSSSTYRLRPRWLR